MTTDAATGSTALENEVHGPWLDPGVAAAYATWHPWLEQCFAPTARVVSDAAGIRPGMHVLDIATGTGIPSLAIAQRVGQAGRVTATDPSRDLLTAAESNAQRLGLDNIAFQQAAAGMLPFPDRMFDAATCHLGSMFFPDVGKGLREILRVLKPGSRAAFVAWGPEARIAFFTTFWDVVARYEQETSAVPASASSGSTEEEDEPNPYRFASPGTLAGHLRNAGFGDVQEVTLEVVLPWPGPAETLQKWWLDIAGIPETIPASHYEAFLTDVLAEMRRFARGDRLDLPALTIVASGKVASVGTSVG